MAGSRGPVAPAEHVDPLWDAGRAAWPSVAVELDAFRDFVGPLAVDPELAPDAYLACACALRVPEAIAAFEASVGPTIDRVIRRASPDLAQWDDLRQLVRERLFVGTAAGPGKIAQYSGRAPLRSWARVVALRAVRTVQRKRLETPAEEAIFASLIEPHTAEDAAVEGALLRAYKAAFERAFAGLPADARALLRLSVLDGLGIDALARLLRVHRATAARRLVAVREQLLKAMLDVVRHDEKLTPSEAASALRVILSKIDLSLARVMGDDEESSDVE